MRTHTHKPCRCGSPPNGAVCEIQGGLESNGEATTEMVSRRRRSYGLEMDAIRESIEVVEEKQPTTTLLMSLAPPVSASLQPLGDFASGLRELAISDRNVSR